MRERFDQQLTKLNEGLIGMGALCEASIKMAVRALNNQDWQAVSKVKANEKEINKAERELQNLCITLLLIQQPVAKDLRQISAALKMVTDIQRIGDQAADITELVNYVNLDGTEYEPHIRAMSEKVTLMVTQSIDAFVSRNLELAGEVIDEDDVVDSLFSQIKLDLIDMIRKKETKGEEVVDILMIAKYLERIGDHAVNIAKWVHFSITGVYNGKEESL